MFANSRFDVFDPQHSKWSRYCEQLKHYLIANKVEETLKLSTVLSLIGDYTFNLLCDLIAPDLPSSRTVDEVLEVLNQHFSPKPISRLERYKFRSRKQAQDESISDFVAALRKLSLNCNFNETLDINLADQFVMGIFNSSIQKRLLTEEDDSPFSKLVQIASVAEMTAKDSFTNRVYSTSEVCKVQHSRMNKGSPIPEFTSQKHKQTCKHCGSTSHLPLKCKYINAICNFCKKKGHISPICRAKESNKDGDYDKRFKSRRVHDVIRDSRSTKATMATDDSIILNHFSINKISENREIKPFMFKLKINGIYIDFELDSGASISLIPLNIFKRHIPFVKYNKTQIILSAFNHQILPIGKAIVNVEFNHRVAQNLELFIVKEGSLPLIGRTWFKALGFLSELFQPVLTIKNSPIDSSLELIHPEEIPDDVLPINQIETFPISYQDIAAETIIDTTLRQVLRFSKAGWPNSVSPDLVPYKSRSEEISHQDNCLLWGLRVLIPNSLRSILLKELHYYHTGIVRMKMMARSLFWWPNLDRDIERIAHSCEQCSLQSSDPPKAPLHPWISPDNPWERVHIDYAGPFMGHMFLVLVDAFSKWPEVCIMNNTDTISTATALEEYFTRYGYPLHLVTDNGTQFTSTKFETYCKNRGIHHTLSAPYHPSSNGQAERFVQILKRFLKTFPKKQFLRVRVNELLFSYRSTPHTLTKKTPAELFLGHNIRNRLQLIKPPSKPLPYEPNSTSKPRSFSVGQQVLTKSFKKNDVNRWTPAKIYKRYGPLTYLLEFPDGKFGKRHIDQLRPSHLKEGVAVTAEPDALTDDDDEFSYIKTPASTTQPTEAVAGTEPQRRYPLRIRRPPARFRSPLRRE